MCERDVEKYHQVSQEMDAPIGEYMRSPLGEGHDEDDNNQRKCDLLDEELAEDEVDKPSADPRIIAKQRLEPGKLDD